MSTDNYKSDVCKFYILIDLFILMLSYGLAWFIRIANPWFGVSYHNQKVMLPVYLAVLVVIVPFHLCFYLYQGLYDRKIISPRFTAYRKIVKANLICLLSVTFLLYLYGKLQPFYDFSRSMLLLYYLLNTLISIVSYMGLLIILRFLYSRDSNQTHVLLVGYSLVAEELIDRIDSNTIWGYQIHGILDDHKKIKEEYKGVPVIGTISALSEQLKNSTYDEVAITLSICDYNQIEDIVSICEKSGVHTIFIPDYQSFIPTTPCIEDLQGMPVIHIRHLPLDSWFNQLIKRLADILGAILLLVFLSPILLITVFILKLLSAEPPFICQDCVGLHRKVYRTYEFRTTGTLRTFAEKSNMKIGHWIQRTGIFKLPLLVNVLKGEMSFIGPYPETSNYAAQQKEENARYMIRYQVRPGLTGWTQVKNRLSTFSKSRKLTYDLYYIENWTFFLDLKILYLSIRNILINFFNK